MRKSIRELAWNVDEPTYRADHAISYSTLSRFEREGWRRLSTLFDKIETPSLVFGAAVDTMLTDGVDAFKERFIVCEFPALSDNLKQITKALHKKFKDEHRKLSTIPDKEIDNMAVIFNYYANPKYAEYRVKQVKENCDEYYSLLTLAEEKTILSQEDYDDVMNCIDELKSNPATKSYFWINPFDTDVEKVFQLKFKAEYNGIPVRCMFDELWVDHKQKIIIPIDLKTTGHPEDEFDGSFTQWRYDIQAKLYSYILYQNIKNDEYFKDFKILEYNFVVINRRTLAPLVWIFEQNFSQVDFFDADGKVLRDWRKILEELNYYLNNPSGKYSREAEICEYRMRIRLEPCR